MKIQNKENTKQKEVSSEEVKFIEYMLCVS